MQTRSVVNGDHYMINGQKIWTSGANHADWTFCLIRTDTDAPKHNGITFVLFDMDQPGVMVKPINLTSGLSPFCQTIFEDARVISSNVVGKVSEGWILAKRLLQYEGTRIGGQRPRAVAEFAKDFMCTQDGRIADRSLRDDIAEHAVNDRAFSLTVRRNVTESQSTQTPSLLYV